MRTVILLQLVQIFCVLDVCQRIKTEIKKFRGNVDLSQLSSLRLARFRSSGLICNLRKSIDLLDLLSSSS